MGPTLIIFSFWSPNPTSVPQQFSWQSAPVEWKIRILSLASLTSCPMGCHAQRGPMPNRALCPTGRHVQPRNHQQSEIIAHPKGAMPCQRDTALPMGALPSPNARYPAQPRTLTYKALWPATITLTLAPYSKPQCPKTRQVS